MTSALHTRAAAIDTVIAAKHAALGKATANVRWALDTMRSALGDSRNRNGVFALSVSETLDRTNAVIAEGGPRCFRLAEALKYHTEFTATWKVAYDEFMTESVKYEGWSRFFLVLNNGGHVHSSMECHTCFVDTDFAWLPELSGLTEVEAVEAHGEILCSVCYPSAPVEWTNGTSKVSKDAKAKRAAEKAAREAKKLEKAITLDGTDLVIVDDYNRKEYLRTLVSARNWAIDAVRSHKHWGYPAHTAAVATIVEAIAVKTGKTVDEVRAAIDKSASKVPA
jgi:hypothetical protein